VIDYLSALVAKHTKATPLCSHTLKENTKEKYPFINIGSWMHKKTCYSFKKERKTTSSYEKELNRC